jgi:hypothetical protein
MDTAYCFWRSKVLFAAVELDVFTILSSGALSLADLMSRTAIHNRGAHDFFDSLVAVGLLERGPHDEYFNAPESDLYLVRDKRTYIGDLLKHLDARHYKNWDLLTRALRTGEPQSNLGMGSYRRFYADDRAQEMFLSGMTAGSLLAAQALARVFPWHRYRTVIDIGTAQGCVPVEIARVQQHISGGGFDLPALEPTFTTYVDGQLLADRLTFYPGDFLSERLPQADVLVMGRILHNWEASVRTMLLDKAYQAICPGGALIVYDPMIDDARYSRAHSLLSSLNMLIETPAGSEYTIADCKVWMLRAGFHDVTVQCLDEIHTAVIGMKLDGGA